jgi:TolA-binding protein
VTLRRFLAVLVIVLLCAMSAGFDSASAQNTKQTTPTATAKADPEDQIAELSKQLERKTKEASTLRKQRNEAQRQVEDLQAEIDDLTAENKDLKAENKDLQARVAELEEGAVTPTPTATTGCATTAELAYFTELYDITSRYGDNFQEITDLTDSSTWMYDPDSLTEFVDLMGNFHGYYQEMLQLTPPTQRLQAMHDQVLAATYHMDQAATYVETAVSTVDVDYLDLATTEINLATEEITKATDSLDGLSEDLCLDSDNSF